MKFYICDETRKTPCIFTESSMRMLWKRSGGDIARCVRHGQLICTETDQPDKKAARLWATPISKD